MWTVAPGEGVGHSSRPETWNGWREVGKGGSRGRCPKPRSLDGRHRQLRSGLGVSWRASVEVGWESVRGRRLRSVGNQLESVWGWMRWVGVCLVAGSAMGALCFSTISTLTTGPTIGPLFHGPSPEGSRPSGEPLWSQGGRWEAWKRDRAGAVPNWQAGWSPTPELQPGCLPPGGGRDP